ncbi:MAG: lysoplasmalogenase [Actinomycetota bacterium]
MPREQSMTALAFLLLSLTCVVAVCDWLVVANNSRAAEYVLKPLVMVFLIAVAVTLDPSSDFARLMLVIGLVSSMAGDIALMLPTDKFLAGLGAFFVAHIFYVVGLVALGISFGGLVFGVVLMGLIALLVGRRIVQGAGGVDKALIGPVSGYIAVISLMVASAIGTGQFFAIAGALLFASSDSLLGWTRFVSEVPKSRIIVMVTYHLGQIGLVLALI